LVCNKWANLTWFPFIKKGCSLQQIKVDKQ